MTYRTKIRTAFLAVLLLLYFVANAAEPDESAIDRLAAEIAMCSPELRGAALSGAAEAADIEASNRLADPEAEMEQLWGLHHVGQKFTAGISQEFNLPNLYRSRSRLASALVSETEARQQGLFIEKRLEAKSLIIRLSYALRILETRQELTRLATEADLVCDSMYQTGHATRLDLYKSRSALVDARRSEEETLRLCFELKEQLARLNGGQTVRTSEIPVPERLPEAPEEWERYQSDYDTRSPQSLISERTTATTLMRKKVLNAERWPTFSLGYSYNGEFGDRFHGFSFAMTLPVWSRRSERRAAELNASLLSVENETAATETLSDMRLNYSLAQSLAKELGMFDRLFDGDGDIAVVERMYATGLLTRTEYLAEIISLTEARATRLETERDYALALASLNRFR
ncbi:MAG: TolC family protein [Clostridium sp.]|nr:TolC family protein [Clostridium sp.]